MDEARLEMIDRNKDKHYNKKNINNHTSIWFAWS